METNDKSFFGYYIAKINKIYFKVVTKCNMYWNTDVFVKTYSVAEHSRTRGMQDAAYGILGYKKYASRYLLLCSTIV